jgi:hypothetical protein
MTQSGHSRQDRQTKTPTRGRGLELHLFQI